MHDGYYFVRFKCIPVSISGPGWNKRSESETPFLTGTFSDAVVSNLFKRIDGWVDDDSRIFVDIPREFFENGCRYLLLHFFPSNWLRLQISRIFVGISGLAGGIWPIFMFIGRPSRMIGLHSPSGGQIFVSLEPFPKCGFGVTRIGFEISEN